MKCNVLLFQRNFCDAKGLTIPKIDYKHLESF